MSAGSRDGADDLTAPMGKPRSILSRTARILAIVLMTATAFDLSGCSVSGAPARAPCGVQPIGEVALRGGAVVLGEGGVLPEEGPPRHASVGAFAIDRTEVTNAQFTEFVTATGYITLAERAPDPALYPGVPASKLKPSSIVFMGAKADPNLSTPGLWWQVVPGADWRHPEGPGSDLKGRDRRPVVHVGYQDALAYAKWHGRDLPSEAEWEYAAHAGLAGARYEWGDAAPTAASPRANYWQGPFPAIDTGDDGYKATSAPVGCYAPSAYGLYDMSGNVWEWTSSRYGRGPESRVIKGGSFLCADNYCYRYRPQARQAGPPDTGSSHIGFRTIRRIGRFNAGA